MKRYAILALGALMLGLPSTAPMVFAQSATTATATLTEVSFNVPDMTCALCPVTVKAAMSGVEGVQSVEVDFDARSATVSFDPALTDAAAIADASAQAGDPANVKG
ncbi:MAG: heavy metal-associated domain-containing protein [Paracoccaceae bacterium]|nr:heavy metal-associated domain-containing protein [Paracoccaceae bacterium]